MMPGVDGPELCRRIRAVSQLPIIVLSVRGEERTKVEALDAVTWTLARMFVSAPPRNSKWLNGGLGAKPSVTVGPRLKNSKRPPMMSIWSAHHCIMNARSSSRGSWS